MDPGMFHLFRKLEEELEVAGPLTRHPDYRSVQEHQQEYGGHPRTALHNITGVLQWQLGADQLEKEAALETFTAVLQEDPDNLNAWANSRFVYSELGRQEDAEVCAKKLSELLHMSPGSDEGGALRSARCLAEQGLTLSRDFGIWQIEFGGKDLDRYLQASDYYKRAFRLDSDRAVFSTEERCQWKQFHAMTLHHVFGHYWRIGDPRAQLEAFDEAVSALSEVKKRSTSENYRAKAWCLLGTFFWKLRSSDPPQSVIDCDLVAEYRTPEKCFEAARKQSPTDCKILSRYSRFLIKGKRWTEAIQLLNRSIEMDDSSNNWFAFPSRAFAYLKLYLSRGSMGARRGRNLLLEAKADYQRAQTMTDNVQDRVSLGHVLYLLKEYDEAMEQLQFVVDHLNGQKDEAVHRHMGCCLVDMAMGGDHSRDLPRRAVEAFKRAVECERSDWTTRSLEGMLRLLLEMYERQAEPGYLLHEICFWLAEAHAKYGDAVTSRIERIFNEFGPQMLRVCQAMVANGQCSPAETCLSYLKRIPTTPFPARRMISQLQDEMSALSMSDAEPGASPAAAVPSRLMRARNGVGKQYDWLALHCKGGRDAEWVHYSLLPRLEDCHEYKGYILARDIQPDAPPVTEVVNDAACVIVVLTPAFCDDESCQDLLGTLVQDEERDLLAVLLEDCDVPGPLTLRGVKVIQAWAWEMLLHEVKRSCDEGGHGH